MGDEFFYKKAIYPLDTRSINMVYRFLEAWAVSGDATEVLQVILPYLRPVPKRRLVQEALGPKANSSHRQRVAHP